ncbi:penicillin-binding protein 2 [Bacillus sp. HMF5848]|uniref:peptidoglycan D,D-transpeptidase FtsI family protein n=1 Tax=Bacillus sp. HMF5848 TaxID=2495421 RepID=UPI000F7B8A9C|nr:penicillin-binding protein 2 [Bacillus sp. HMF5848]RSK27958.1 penicillin-binding protein 2 [Bacillus sp. HMF5848]
MRIVKHRLKVVAFLVFIFLVVLVGRLMQIQIIDTESFSKHQVNLIEGSVNQRTQAVVIDNGRGQFVDRNLEPLTVEYKPALILFPFLKHMKWPIQNVASIINTSSHAIEETLKHTTEPVVFTNNLTEAQMAAINDMKIPGVFAIYKQQELQHPIASHLIGLVRYNEDLFRERYPDKQEQATMPIGITGLQAAFDEFLFPEGESKLLYHVDAKSGPLFGINVKYHEPANPFYPVTIKTTIDKSLQNEAEKIIEHNDITNGGLVLLDIETNELLALVSAPVMNPADPFKNGAAQNRMLLPQFPGSVFKTVIAAGAIESNLVKFGETFDCSLNLYGQHDTQHNLGLLSFSDSFAQSCNYTFATLGKRLQQNNKNNIEKFADMLGLIQKNGWIGDLYHFEMFEQLPDERNGSIWGDSRDKSVDKAIAQTAIGQKEVRVSPLAIANMMATIARGGSKQQIRIVDEILYKNGSTMHRFNKQKLQGDKISPYTAMQLQKLLHHVVEAEQGTGRAFQSLSFDVAGKSGTAETGKYTADGVPLVNKWFAGYFPFENPKYALVVVELEKRDGTSNTNKVYYEFAKHVYERSE